ncbi:TonB-dependent receptor domain-containing protein [Wenyingzhuangia sp. IMCC45574]
MKKIFFLLFLISLNPFQAQNKETCNYELKGVILDADTKEPLPFVKVEVKGTTLFDQTNIKGEFHIQNLCTEGSTLIISCYGYCDTVCEGFHQHGKSPHIFLKHEVESLNGLTITAEKIKDDGTASIAQKVLGKKQFSLNSTQSLAAAISEVEGVTFTSVGNNVQLPVIHGLYGNRVLIVNNGLKHGFQNWGTDHAPEIDITSAHTITVIKGAAGVKYGPEALGGAVVIEGDPLYLNEPFKGTVGTGYQTNGRGYFLNSEAGHGGDNFSYHLGVNYTKIGDKETPDYLLRNSGKEEKSFNAGLRYHLEDWDFKVYYSFLNQNVSILRASVAESAIGFLNIFEADRPILTRPFSYSIEEPNQLTKHHLLKAEVNWWYSDEGKLTLKIGRQLNQREEYDVRRNADKPIIDLDLITNDFQLEWKHPDWFQLDGLVGLQLFTQNNDNNPGTDTTPFIPNYNTLRYSAFVVESLKKGKNTFEFGVRLDVENNNVRGRETNQDIFRDDYTFSNITSSLGYIRQISDDTSFRTNIGTAWRTPNMAELYSFGQHGFKRTFGLLRYYFNAGNELNTDRVTLLDNSNIEPEKGFKWINEWHKHIKTNTYTLTAYTHLIENYIFDRPYGVVGSRRGPMPVYVVDQADAVFVGADFSWQKKWSKSLRGVLGLNYLWSRNTKKDEPLINQPPAAVNYKLTWKSKKLWKFRANTISIKPSYVFKQFKAPRTVSSRDLVEETVIIYPESEIFDFKDAPAGNFVLDASWKFKMKAINASVSVENLLNNKYRNYLNETRYFVDEPGRNFLFTINYTF